MLSPNKNSATNYRPDIDGLRAIAVLSVIFFHAFPESLSGGFSGVDIFFVISGFLISRIILHKLDEQKFSFADFYWRRIKRIFPALLVIFTATFALGWFLLMPTSFSILGREIASAATFHINFTLWKDAGYFDPAATAKPLLHLWSLSLEEQFYFVWPLLLWIVAKLRWPVLPICLLLGAASFLTCLWIPPAHTEMNFYLPGSRFWEIIAGALVAILLAKSTPWLQNKTYLQCLLGGLGLGCLVIGDFYISASMHYPGIATLLPVGGAGLVIFSGPRTFIHRLLAQRVFRGIGLISYSLYLWHWPVLYFLRYSEAIPNPKILGGLSIVISIALATLTYFLIENPVRHWSWSRRNIWILSGLMILAFAAGRAIFLSEGVKERLPLNLQKYSSFNFQWNSSVRDGSCHIQDYEKTQRPDFCIEKQRPLTLLWGDSHASSLYPGLHELQKTKTMGITQLTKANCPPLIDTNNATVTGCQENNQKVLQIAKKLQPDVVILDAFWETLLFQGQEQMIEKLKNAVQRLQRELPHAHIVVMGPVPWWRENFPDVFIEYHLKQEHAENLVDRLNYKLSPATAQLDAHMQKEFTNYLSPYQLFCNSEGCMTRVGADPGDLLTVDRSHLSPAASIFLIKNLLK